MMVVIVLMITMITKMTMMMMMKMMIMIKKNQIFNYFEGAIATAFQLKLCCLIFEQNYFSKVQMLYFPAQ